MNNDKQLTPEHHLEFVIDQFLFDSKETSLLEYDEINKNVIIDHLKSVSNDYASQQTAAKDEEIEAVKFDLQLALQSSGTMLKQKDERINELEGLHQSEKNLREQSERVYNIDHALSLGKDARIAELEKELSEIRKRLALECTDMVRVMGERDQAYDLLERVYNIEMVHPGKEDIPLLEMISTLLSSRENKKQDER